MGGQWCTRDGSGNTTRYYVYDYDANSNRTNEVQYGVATGTAETTYTYDGNSRLTTEVTGGNTTTYTYDANNGLERVVPPSSPATYYEYDYENRPVKVSSPTATIAEYVRDGQGTAVWKNDAYGQAYFYYDGIDIYKEDDKN